MHLNVSSMRCAVVVQSGVRQNEVLESQVQWLIDLRWRGHAMCLEFIVMLSEQQRAKGGVGWNWTSEGEHLQVLLALPGFYVPFCLPPTTPSPFATGIRA